MKKIALKLLLMSDAVLLAFANTLHSNALSNPIAASSPLIPSLKSTKDDFAVSLVAAADKGRSAIIKKSQDRKLLESAIRLYASYVEDNIVLESDIASLGFTVAIRRTSTGAPTPPLSLSIHDSALSGSALVKFKNVKNARVYQLRHGTTFGEWDETFLPFTKSKAVIQGISPGSTIWVQVRSVNANGHSEWSDIATMMVR